MANTSSPSWRSSPDRPAQPSPASTVSELVSYRYGIRSVSGTDASMTCMVLVRAIRPSASTYT